MVPLSKKGARREVNIYRGGGGLLAMRSRILARVVVKRLGV